MEYSYYLIYRTGKNGSKLLFNIGSGEKTDTLLRLEGRRTKDLFVGILDILSRAGCISPIRIGDPSIYAVRDDVGPVVGSYLILVKRSRNVKYWTSFLEELIFGKYSTLGGAFSQFLEIAIDLSKGSPWGRRGYTLSPPIVSSLSSALKVFVKQLEKHGAKAAATS
ncbi:MAG: hypothetical protein P3X22_001015 [Thermoprotei archaeon]|nr:hypothetical protein [Thermoprotei archaeon]